MMTPHGTHKRHLILLAYLYLALNAGAKIVENLNSRYESEAKILIQMVVERPGKEDPVLDHADAKELMRAEREILISDQLATEVAKSVGVQRLIPIGKGENPDPELAAAVIKRGLKVSIPEKSRVITVTYQHPKPELAKAVLEKLTEEYFRFHLEQHRAKETPTSALDLARRRVQDLETEVNKLRKNPTTTKADLKMSKALLVAAGLELRKLEQNQKGARVAPIPSPSAVPNISIIQKPSEPREVSR